MRVLLVRLGAFGDIVHTLPLAADLHAAGHHVGWVCEDRWAALLRDNPVIDRLHLLPRGRWRRDASPLAQRRRDLRQLRRELRNAGYQAAIDAQGLAKSAALLLASAAPRRVGHQAGRARELSWLATRHRSPALASHVIDQQRALALALGTVARGGWRFPLPAWGEERARINAWLTSHDLVRPWTLNVGAGWPTKVWPHAHQRAFASACTAAGTPLVLAWGSPSERATAEEVAADTGAILAPATSIGELGALLAASAVVVSGDTGPLHLALALGTPTVGLFGPVPGSRNGPRGLSHRVLQAPGASWERRDVTRVDMGAISPAVVLEAAQSVARHGAVTHCLPSRSAQHGRHVG
ncbi:MAG: glycosyltransferase family 9 protein [Planctomycetota bacterium]